MSPADAAAVALALALGMGAGQDEAVQDGVESEYGFDTVPDDGNVRIQNNTSAAIRCTRVGRGDFVVPDRRTYVFVGSPVTIRCPGTNVAGGVNLRSGARYVFLPGAAGAELRTVR
jgi:hypothetical protein